MILDRWRLRSGLPAVDVAPPARSSRWAPKHVTIHEVDGERWASCTRCPWTSVPGPDLDDQVAGHTVASCGLVAR